MKYVIGRYGQYREGGLKRLLRRMGVYKKYDIEESFIADTEGYIITLPFLESDLGEKPEYCLEQAEKAIKHLKSGGEDIVYAMPYGLRPYGGRNGLYTAALAAASNFGCLTEKRDMKYAKTVIAGMDIKAVMTVMDGIYDNLNSLYILAPTDRRLTERAREIYCETGLDIIFITNIKSEFFTGADIVINCGMDMADGVNAVKKDALYICLCGGDGVCAEREDIKCVNMDRLVLDGEELDSAGAEAVLCAKTYAYRNFCTSVYYRDKAKRAVKTADLLMLRR